jgi:hypothetical protein
MSGTRHADTHVEYILDTETWLGPYGDTPYALVEETAALIVASGLKARPFEDLRPAQWSKLIFNATVNGVAALTGLPHDPHFAAREQPGDLGFLGGGRRRAPRGPVGDERPCDSAGQPALPFDARGRRGPPADGGGIDQRLTGPAG